MVCWKLKLNNGYCLIHHWVTRIWLYCTFWTENDGRVSLFYVPYLKLSLSLLWYFSRFLALSWFSFTCIKHGRLWFLKTWLVHDAEVNLFNYFVLRDFMKYLSSQFILLHQYTQTAKVSQFLELCMDISQQINFPFDVMWCCY